LVENLAIHLQPHQRLEFEKRAISLLQESTAQPQTKPCNSPSLQEQAIDASVFRQCERELADLVGPIATFLVQKALKSHPQISLTELVKTLAANISDPQKALEFQQRFRLLS
jgi:serine/threonine-protein kinase